MSSVAEGSVSTTRNETTVSSTNATRQGPHLRPRAFGRGRAGTSTCVVPPLASTRTVPPAFTSTRVVPPPFRATTTYVVPPFTKATRAGPQLSAQAQKPQLGSIKEVIARAKRMKIEPVVAKNEEPGPSAPIPTPVVILSSILKSEVPEMIQIVDSDSDDDELQAAMKESAAMSSVGFTNDLRAVLPAIVDPNPRPRTSLETKTEGLKILLTFEDSSCSFCTVELRVGEGVVLQDCFHAFCRTCIATAVETSESAEIQCPLFHDCSGRMYESEIKAVLITPEKYEEHLTKSFASMNNVFHCKAPNCHGRCIFEEGNKVFLCPSCNKSNCLQCKAIHDGLECKQYQDLVKASMESGKSLEEAQALIVNKAANGWDQMVSTVAGWVATSSTIAANRKSLGYSSFFQQMEVLEYLPNSQEFDCPVCFDTIPPGEGVIFQECFHMCCKECCVALVQNSDEPRVKCPYQDVNYSCVCYLQPREIRALVSAELYETHLARSVKIAENAMTNSFHCKTTDCGGWCEIEEGATVYKCQICGKKNCLKCNAIHEGVSCDDYKNGLVQGENDLLSSAAVEDLIKKGVGMRCPQCKAVVEKIVGCDWVVCSLCKTELCWATKGPRWGPAGKGDTSGGCKCRLINNKLCTPNCQNCH